MDAWRGARGTRDVLLLVVEVDVGLQHFRDDALLDSTEEERVVDRDAPRLETLDSSLVRRRIASRDDRDVNANLVCRRIQTTTTPSIRMSRFAPEDRGAM